MASQGSPPNLDVLRGLCEKRYYAAGGQPRGTDDLVAFTRAVGVFPVPSVVDTKLRRRRTAFGTSLRPPSALPADTVTSGGDIMPFAEVFAFVGACFTEGSRVDPAAAEDNDYFAEAWEACGGTDLYTDTVSLGRVRGVFAALGFGEAHISKRRGPRPPKGQGQSPEDRLTFKEFTDALIGADMAPPRTDVDEADEAPNAEVSYRPRRLSVNIVSRVKTVVRAFRERVAARRAEAERSTQLAAYEARYFTPGGGGGGGARDRPGRLPPRSGGGAALPPLVDDRGSQYDRLLQLHERQRRRGEREKRSTLRERMLRSHPRSDGCADVVSRYARRPVASPLRQRVDNPPPSPCAVAPYCATTVGRASSVPVMRPPSRSRA